MQKELTEKLFSSVYDLPCMTSGAGQADVIAMGGASVNDPLPQKPIFPATTVKSRVSLSSPG